MNQWKECMEEETVQYDIVQELNSGFVISCDSPLSVEK